MLSAPASIPPTTLEALAADRQGKVQPRVWNSAQAFTLVNLYGLDLSPSGTRTYPSRCGPRHSTLGVPPIRRTQSRVEQGGGAVGDRELAVTSCQTSPLLGWGEGPLGDGSPFVEVSWRASGSGHRGSPVLVRRSCRSLWDDGRDAPDAELAADRAGRVRLVCDHRVRAGARSAPFFRARREACV